MTLYDVAANNQISPAADNFMQQMDDVADGF